MEFDPEIAQRYARAIARPRRVGSGDDEIAAQEIAGRLERFGYRVERQPFRFSTAPAVFVSLQVLAGSVLILVILLTRATAGWAWAVPAGLLLLLILLNGSINRAVEAGSLAPDLDGAISFWSALCLRIGEQHTTANLVAALPGLPDDPALPQLYLMAHYDSKSQRMPLAVRIALFTTAIVGGLGFVGLVCLESVLPSLWPVALVVGIVTMAAGFPLIFLDAGNASPGAIDNASGVGVALHLAECLTQSSELRERLRVTVLFTSAEEMTLMGAAAFLRRNERGLRLQAEAGKLYLFNFDGPGVDGWLGWAGRKRSRSGALIRAAGRELGLAVRRFSLLGLSYDHAPFVQRGFDAVSLIAIGLATWAVHTPGDSVDKLHVRGFRQTGQVAMRVIEKIAGL